MHDAKKEKKISKDLTDALRKTFKSPGNVKKIDAFMKKQGEKGAAKPRLPKLDALLGTLAAPVIQKFEKSYFRYQIKVSIIGVPKAPTEPKITVDAAPKHMSMIHHDIIHLAEKSKTPKDVNEWSTWDIVKWKFPKLGDANYIHEFKQQWVVAYHDIIVTAAKQYDLPVEVVGGVAYNEVGGDPQWIDDVARNVRSLDRTIPFKDVWTSDPDKTSFGNLSMQIKVAAKELGYDPAKLNNNQRALILDSLKKPRQQIFIVAKHLSGLRDVDYKGVKAGQMTKEQKMVVLTRYNRGGSQSLEAIKKNLDYGKVALSRYAAMKGKIK